MTKTANAFEDRLLDALLDRFDTTAHQPAAHPHFRRRASIRRGTAAVGCLGAAVALIVALEPGGSTPNTHVGSSSGGRPQSAIPAVALAAWTIRPTSASQTQITAAQNHCAASFGQVGASQPSVQKEGPQENGGPWSPDLVDTRGDLTLTLYNDTTQWMTCFESSSFVLISTISSTSATPVADNTATLDYLRVRGDGSSDGYTLAVGRSGSAVLGVGLHRTDGSVVTASVGDGHFIAWWPGGDGVNALSVTTTSGTQNVPVDPSFAQSNPQPNNKTVHQLPGAPSK